MSYYTRDKCLISMNNSLKDLKIVKDISFLNECILSTSKLFTKDNESDKVKCNLFKHDLVELEKIVPSFTTNQELGSIALQHRD